jgi:hypothetical protein
MEVVARRARGKGSRSTMQATIDGAGPVAVAVAVVAAGEREGPRTSTR